MMNCRTKAVRGKISIPPVVTLVWRTTVKCVYCACCLNGCSASSLMLSSKPNLPRGSSQISVCFSQDASLMPTCFTSYGSHCMFWCAVALFCTTTSLLLAVCFHCASPCSSLHGAPVLSVPVLRPLFALCSFIISGLRTLSQSDT